MDTAKLKEHLNYLNQKALRFLKDLGDPIEPKRSLEDQIKEERKKVEPTEEALALRIRRQS